MILTTHIIVTAAAAKTIGVTDPGHALLLGIALHFLLDAIPHWEYSLSSISGRRGALKDRKLALRKKDLIRDLSLIALDGMIGTLLFAYTLSFSLAHIFSPLFIVIIIGSILPDMLQPVGLLHKKTPFVQINAFQHWIHANKKLPAFPLGIISQGTLVLMGMLILTTPMNTLFLITIYIRSIF
jgi:hypothetical protein